MAQITTSSNYRTAKIFALIDDLQFGSADDFHETLQGSNLRLHGPDHHEIGLDELLSECIIDALQKLVVGERTLVKELKFAYMDRFLCSNPALKIVIRSEI